MKLIFFLYLIISSFFTEPLYSVVFFSTEKNPISEKTIQRVTDSPDSLFVNEWKKYKIESERKLEKKEKKIKELKQSKNISAELKTKLESLESEYKKMKMDLMAYKFVSRQDATEFMKAFDQRLDKLKKDLKEINE